MKNKNKAILVFLAATLMLATSMAAPKLPANQVVKENNKDNQFSNTELHPAQEKSFLSLSFLLSSLETNDLTVHPGGTAGFKSKLDVLTAFENSNANLVFTVYDCGDSECENPPQEDINGDGKVDSCDLEGDVRQGKDDCIDSVSTPVDDISPIVNGYLGGQTLEASTNYMIESDADTGTYIAESYVWTTTNSIVTDTPEEKFEVVEEDTSDPTNPDDTSDSDGDGVINSNDSCKYEFGNKDNGCPVTDYDKDGVKNTEDACTNVFGEKPNGCPVKDSDNDGVTNSQDSCSEKKGLVSNNGCPSKNNGFPVLPVAGFLIVLTLGGVYLFYG